MGSGEGRRKKMTLDVSGREDSLWEGSLVGVENIREEPVWTENSEFSLK